MKLSQSVSAALAVLLLSGTGFSQQMGKVTGVVIDEFNGMTLPMAPVEVVESGEIVYTELDGKYSVNLPPGTYELKASFGGYQDHTVSVTVAAGQVVSRDIPISMERFTEEVTVTAETETPQLFTAEAQLIERRKAVVISDNLASEDMKKNADSDAASAMQRVTGLSVVDGQYVFVRGLGERYSNTQLNGATLPTTEPDKKVVPLDLFPSGMIESVQVKKTYLPDQPGDFTGGLVQIEPLAFPERQLFDFSLGYGFNGQTTFNGFQTYPGGHLDFLGFDDGTRALPSIIPTDDKIVRSNIFTGGGYSRDQLAELGRAFSNVWSPRIQGSAKPNQSYSLVWGNSTERLGAVFSFAYNYKNQRQTEVQNFYKVGGDETITLQNDYDFDVSTTDTNMGMVGNLAFKINGQNRISFDNFFTNNSSNETRLFEGFNKDANNRIRDSRLFWVEEKIYSGKISGEHFLPNAGNSRIDWRATFSNAKRDEPDLRETLYEFDPSRSDYVLADESQSAFRMFNNLDDNVYEAGLDWSFFATQWSGLPAMFKVGPYVLYRERDFSSRRFRFKPIAAGQIDITQPPEAILAPENIGPYYELSEDTRNTDSYNADQTITAAYGMVDLPLNERLRVIGGLRVERSEQNVNTFDLFAVDPTSADVITSTLDDTDFLPGVSAIFSLAGDTNLRFGYSRTVNRPEFRELAPFEFTDVIGGRAVVGNPELRRAVIQNYDARWEWFPGSGEVLAASFFYKDFTDPIERTVQATAQLRTSYTNASGATNRGIELEARKKIVENLLISANYTFVDSNIEIGRDVGQVQTSTDRPLAGQSENVLNLVGEYQIPNAELTFRVLYNFFGDRIIDVGSLGLPDIIEQGRGALDVVAIKRFGPVQFRLVGENLTDADRTFTQGGEIQRLFNIGRTFAVSVSYSMF